jgi:hypothetical protein
MGLMAVAGTIAAISFGLTHFFTTTKDAKSTKNSGG